MYYKLSMIEIRLVMKVGTIFLTVYGHRKYRVFSLKVDCILHFSKIVAF